MAFITKTMLNYNRQKNPGHRPAPVELHFDDHGDMDWWKHNNVVSCIRAMNGSMYHALYLELKDVQAILREYADEMSAATRKKLAVEVLDGFDDSSLLAIIGEVLAKRKAKGKK